MPAKIRRIKQSVKSLLEKSSEIWCANHQVSFFSHQFCLFHDHFPVVFEMLYKSKRGYYLVFFSSCESYKISMRNASHLIPGIGKVFMQLLCLRSEIYTIQTKQLHEHLTDAGYQVGHIS